MMRTPPRPASLAAIILLALLVVTAPAAGQGIGSHLSLGALAGDAAGLDDGYAHFGGFVPIAQPDAESLWFTEGRLLLFNESSDQIGGNVGVGYRSLCDLTGSILGAHAHYDRRDLGVDEFDQIGVGVESIGAVFDARINIAAPLDDAEASNLAFTTVDGEVGALLLERGEAACRSYVGVYGLLHEDADSATGVRGRLEVRLADRWYVGGYVEHDELFDTTGGITFECRYGRGGEANESSAESLLARLGDRTNRRRHVVTADRTALGFTTTGLGGPTTGTPGPLGPPSVTPGGGEETPGRPYRPPLRPALDSAP